MAIWRVNNSATLGGEVCAQWQASHAYSLGARCVVTSAYGTVAARARVFECTTAGTSGGSQPTWDTTVGNTTSDNTVTWTCRNPNDGDWDNASCHIQYISEHASPAAGDFIYVDDGHDEDTDFNGPSGFPTISGAQDDDTPLYFVCVDKADDSLSTGAVINHTAGWNAYIRFCYHGYWYGIKFVRSGGGPYIWYGSTYQICRWTFEADSPETVLFSFTASVIACDFNMYQQVNYSSPPDVLFKNLGFENVSSSSSFILNSGAGNVVFENCKWHTYEVTNMIDAIVSGTVVFRCCDLSAVCTGATARYLLQLASITTWNPKVSLERCKMPSGAGWALINGTPDERNNGFKIALHHCSTSNNVTDFHEETLKGSVSDEGTIVRTGGASCGKSIKMVSNSYVSELANGLESIPIHGWTDSTTSKTFTIEGVWDSATDIQDDEIWMEFQYPKNNTDGLGAIEHDRCALLGTPANQATSTETWTTTGMSNPNKFKLSVTVTPGKAGPITARVYLAKASTTVYIDPLITES